MIALQARNPQVPDPSRVTAQYVNMMNSARQTEAAQRQAQQAQQAMAIAAAKEGRDVDADAIALKKAGEEYVGMAAEQFRQSVATLAEGDIAGAEAARADIIAKIPEYGKYIRPASEWTPEYRLQLMSKAKEIVDKTIPDPEVRMEIAARGGVDAQGRPVPEGTPVEVRMGGFRGAAGTNPIPMAGAATPAPRATPAAPQPAPAGPVPVGEFGETRVVPEDSMPLTPFQQEHIREMQSGLGMSQPASFTRGAGAAPIAPQMAQQIVDTAVKTGMMAQADFDQLMAMAPEQNKQPFMDMLKANNITLRPGNMGPQSQTAVNLGDRPQAAFAVNRNQPMERTLAQYQPVMKRDPNVSPLPGSSQVPIERVRAEGLAGRESPAEAAAKARAVAGANAEAETAKKVAEKLPGRKQVSTLIKKVRAAYEALDKAEAIPSESRGGFANAMDYFASSTLGREAQKMVGTKSSKYLSEIINSRKLLATAIKNATGMSAQEMNSNVELQLTLDALTDPTQGIEAARTTLNTLEELYGAPTTTSAAPRAAPKTPVIPDAAKQMLRKNPSPSQRAFFDRTFGAGAAAKVLGAR
jgi:hypothetical protein